MCLIHIFCLFDLFVFTKAISYDSPYIFTGIQYIKFTAVGEQAVHITITKKMCRNFVVMQRTLSNCLCFTICKRQVNFSVSWL